MQHCIPLLTFILLNTEYDGQHIIASRDIQDDLSSVGPEEQSYYSSSSSSSSSCSPFEFEDLRFDESLYSHSQPHANDLQDDPIPEYIEFISPKCIDRYREFKRLDQIFDGIIRGEEPSVPLHEHPQVRNDKYISYQYQSQADLFSQQLFSLQVLEAQKQFYDRTFSHEMIYCSYCKERFFDMKYSSKGPVCNNPECSLCEKQHKDKKAGCVRRVTAENDMDPYPNYYPFQLPELSMIEEIHVLNEVLSTLEWKRWIQGKCDQLRARPCGASCCVSSITSQGSSCIHCLSP